MKSFLEFFQQIDEKQIQYGKNANYGQVVFFAGGSGSGKGFSINNFIDSSKFKIRDVDALKSMFLKMPKMLAKYPEMRDFNLKNSEDVFALHAIVKKEKIPEKQFTALLSGMKSPDTLPNILFDATLKDMNDIYHFVPPLLNLGYKPENFHITWVLTDFSVAIVRNRERERVVPEDIMLATHSGAAITMRSILGGNLPSYINGSISIVLNNPQEVSYYEKQVPVYKKSDRFSPTSGKETLKNKDGKTVFNRILKGFTYITVKQAGKPMPSFPEMDKQLRQTIITWVMDNAPKILDIEKAYTHN